MIRIDGSLGEGGGQILRTALALSLVTRQAFCAENIRARRKKPGLLHQHLTAVRAAAAVGQAQVEGDALGSLRLTFVPTEVNAGEFHFAVGTAGSTTLVLQTVLPALLLAPGPSRLVLEGGTHNPLAPPYEFLERAFVPLLARMGARVQMRLERPGFYPQGGGQIRVRVQPCRQLVPLELMARGPVRRQTATVWLARLPRHIAERELAVLQRALGWPPESLRVEEAPNSRGPGNVVVLEVESEHVTEVFSAVGQLGVRAEAVADNAVRQLQRYLAARVPVGEHLADQLMLPLALAGGGRFKTLPLSSHARTNLEIIRQFVPGSIRVEPEDRDAWRVTFER